MCVPVAQEVDSYPELCGMVVRRPPLTVRDESSLPPRASSLIALKDQRIVKFLCGFLGFPLAEPFQVGRLTVHCPLKPALRRQRTGELILKVANTGTDT